MSRSISRDLVLSHVCRACVRSVGASFRVHALLWKRRSVTSNRSPVNPDTVSTQTSSPPGSRYWLKTWRMRIGDDLTTDGGIGVLVFQYISVSVFRKSGVTVRAKEAVAAHRSFLSSFTETPVHRCFQRSSKGFTTAGLPIARCSAGTSRVTSAPAATTAPSPRVTPFRMIALAPIKQPLPIATGAEAPAASFDHFPSASGEWKSVSVIKTCADDGVFTNDE
jgi:hypothetical protein